MHPEPLLASFRKVEWAITQIDQLNRDIKAFSDSKPYELVTHIEPHFAAVKPLEVWSVKLTAPLPDDFYPQVSAVLSSIREPLDQAVAAVRRHRKASEAGVAFVFGKDRKGFEAALAKSIEVPLDVRQGIEAMEPFYGGKGHLLAALHYLKNPDKHRSDLVPITTSGEVNLQSIAVFKNDRGKEGAILTIGNRAGKFFVAGKALRRFIPPGYTLPKPRRGTPEIVSGVGMILEPFAFLGPDQGYEIATTIPGTKFQAKYEPTFDVAFREVPGMDCEPICHVLGQMREAVHETLLAFEGRFFS